MKIKLQNSSSTPAVTLQSFLDVSSSLQKMTKSSYRELSRTSSRNTPELQIYISDFENGSVIHKITAEIQQLDPRQLVMAFSQVNAAEIFENLKFAIKFWKVFAQEKDSGKNITVNIINSPNAIVAVDGSTINVSESVYKTAASIQKNGEQLTKPLRRQELASIGLIYGEDVILEERDANCFESPLENDIILKAIVGDIIEFNKKAGTGTFQYTENSQIVKRRFKLMDSEQSIATIDSMKRSHCQVFCHEQYLNLPNGGRTLLKIHVIKVEAL